MPSCASSPIPGAGFSTSWRRAPERSRTKRRALGPPAFAAALSASGIAGSGRGPVLALAAAGTSRLVDGVLATRGDDAGLRPIKPRGVDPVVTRSWLAARQRDRRPALLVGPVEGYDGLLSPIERRGLKFRLPAGSSALVIRGPDASRTGRLRPRLTASLGLARERLWLGWEAEGVATPFLARWKAQARFDVPHWVRVEVGADGRLVVTDLANRGGELRVETSARATVVAGGFTLS